MSHTKGTSTKALFISALYAAGIFIPIALANIVPAMGSNLTSPARGAPLAQIGITIGDGYREEPICSYGYYSEPPYACAPYGYWGPEFFFGGHFRGVGPWEARGRGYNRRDEKNFDKNFYAHDRAGGHEGSEGDRRYGEQHGMSGANGAQGHGGNHGHR